MKFYGKCLLIAVGIFLCVQCTSNVLVVKGSKNKLHQKMNQQTELSQDSSSINLNK